MKKIAFLFIFGVLLNATSFSQVDDINKKSKEQKEKREKPGNNNYDKNGNNSNANETLAEGCFNSLAIGCFQIGMEVFISGLATHHTYLMGKKAEDPTIFCLEIMPHVAYNPDKNYVNFLPRIRGTWGIFSSDLRLNYLNEFSKTNVSVYRSTEWQIFQLNFIAEPVFNFRIGSGIYYDGRSKFTVNEHSAAIGFRINQQKVLLDLEGRYAIDYTTNDDVFTEINFRSSFRLLQSPKINVYLTLGAVYQKYFASVEMMSIQTGFTFNIH